jgi:hypothetical protein
VIVWKSPPPSPLLGRLWKRPSAINRTTKLRGAFSAKSTPVSDAKDEAVREGRRACELLPLSRDALSGAILVTDLATIYAWTREKDLALEQLAVSAKTPNGVTYGELKLDPKWDSLRGDPRFEKILASLAPK